MACCVVTKGQTTQYYFLVLMFVLFFLFFIQVVFNHKKIIKTLPRSGILYYMQYLKLERSDNLEPVLQNILEF